MMRQYRLGHTESNSAVSRDSAEREVGHVPKFDVGQQLAQVFGGTADHKVRQFRDLSITDGDLAIDV
jgi:hypothetical protein